MNNKIHLLRQSLLGSMLFISTLLLAQPVSPVDNSNLLTFLDDMEMYFGDIMQVDANDFLLLINPFLVSGTSTTCAEPVPGVSSQDATQITFNWPASSSASYRVGYMNLMTGQRATTTTNNNSHSFAVDDGLYAFVFQQHCGTGRSRAVIIIYDKVIGLTADRSLPCDCRYKALMNANLQGLSIQALTEFDLLILDGESTIHKMHFKKTCSNCTEFFYNPDCLRTGGVISTNNLDYLEDEDYIATIGFVGPDLALQLNLNSGYGAQLGICWGKNTNAPTDSNPLFQIIPTGTQQYIVRKTSPRTIGTRKMILCNQAGQVLRQWNSFDGEIYEDTIDLSSYPAGMYFLQITDAEGIWVEKLVNR